MIRAGPRGTGRRAEEDDEIGKEGDVGPPPCRLDGSPQARALVEQAERVVQRAPLLRRGVQGGGGVRHDDLPGSVLGSVSLMEKQIPKALRLLQVAFTNFRVLPVSQLSCLESFGPEPSHRQLHLHCFRLRSEI